MNSQYTWHMPSNPNRFEFQRAIEECQKVCEYLKTAATPVHLGGWDGSGEPLFTPSLISFNGRHDTAQTFQIRLDGSGPNSCDTDSLQYDIAVRCCLLIFEEQVNGFTYTGGPSREAWEYSRALIENARTNASDS